MRTLRTSEAAGMLGVSPETLRAWERRFGFPTPGRSAGRQRLYAYQQIATLSEALGSGLCTSSAISAAREGCVSDPQPLVTALNAFRADGADDVMERALVTRPLERTLDVILLPALEWVHEHHGHNSAAWAFAAGWAGEWVARARRMASAEPRRGAVLIGDATAPPLAFTIPCMRVLELCCVRSGIAVLSLPVGALAGIQQAISALQPGAVVIAGSCMSDSDVARWAYRVRVSAGPVPFVSYQRRPDPQHCASARQLPPSPSAAHSRLQDLLLAA